MIEPAHTPAVIASITGPFTLRFAVNGLGKLDSQRLFTATLRAGKKIGMVQMFALQRTL